MSYVLYISCNRRVIPTVFNFFRFSKCMLEKLRFFRNISRKNSLISYSNYFVAGCCFSKGTSETSKSPLITSMKRKIDCVSPATNVSQLNIVEIENDADSYGTVTEKPSSSISEKNRKSLKLENKFDEQEISVSTGELSEDVCMKYEDSDALISKKNAEPKKKKHLNENFRDEPQTTQRKTILKKQRPNYFVAVQICNKKIHNALKEVQDHILDQDKKFEPILTSLPTLHITLMVMHIGDEDTHERALNALTKIHEEYDDVLSKEPLELEIKGLGHFTNRVLFAKISNDDAYKRLSSLATRVNEHFSAASIYSTDTRKNFNPHLTIAKIKFEKKCKHLKKINSSLYSAYNNQYFGHQTIKGIQLLSMTDPKDDNGYYRGKELIFSAFTPPSLECCLDSVEEKKKEVREKIKALTKHLVKPL